VPDLPDPSDLVRGLDALRSALGAPGNVGDALPRAVERAGEVTAALHRLTDEVAKLNAHVERALPLLESFEQHAKRTVPVIESLQQAETGLLSLRRTMRRAARDDNAETDTDAEPGAGERPKRRTDDDDSANPRD
jgi:hypothetical protein